MDMEASFQIPLSIIEDVTIYKVVNGKFESLQIFFIYRPIALVLRQEKAVLSPRYPLLFLSVCSITLTQSLTLPRKTRNFGLLLLQIAMRKSSPDRKRSRLSLSPLHAFS